MLNELNVRIFLSLAENLSFTETGNKMFMSQQAVSKHIESIEKELNCRLFFRTRSVVRLTENGTEYYNFFRNFIDKYDKLRNQVHDFTDSDVTTIKMGCMNWLDFGRAPAEAMSLLKKKNPSTFLLSNVHGPWKLVEMIDKQKLDIILMLERFVPQMEGIHKVALRKVKMQLATSADNSLADGETFDKYAKYPVLIDALKGESDGEAILRARKDCQKYGFNPINIIVVPNRDSIYSTASISESVFFCSEMAIFPQNSQFVRYNIDYCETLYCLWRERETGMLIETYVKYLQKQYRKMETEEKFPTIKTAPDILHPTVDKS